MPKSDSLAFLKNFPKNKKIPFFQERVFIKENASDGWLIAEEAFQKN